MLESCAVSVIVALTPACFAASDRFRQVISIPELAHHRCKIGCVHISMCGNVIKVQWRPSGNMSCEVKCRRERVRVRVLRHPADRSI
jgi:hypothetical protein